MYWKTTLIWRYLFLNVNFVDVSLSATSISPEFKPIKTMSVPSNKVFLMIIIFVELSKVNGDSKKSRQSNILYLM